MANWLLIVAFLVAPVSALFGVLAGAWVYHCGRTGQQLMPKPIVDRIRRSAPQEQPDVAKPKLPDVRV